MSDTEDELVDIDYGESNDVVGVPVEVITLSGSDSDRAMFTPYSQRSFTPYSQRSDQELHPGGPPSQGGQGGSGSPSQGDQRVRVVSGSEMGVVTSHSQRSFTPFSQQSVSPRDDPNIRSQVNHLQWLASTSHL